MRIPFAYAFALAPSAKELLASYDNTNPYSYLLVFSQQDIKHVGVCGSSANVPAKILRYVYARSFVYMQAKISRNGPLYLGKQDVFYSP
jgi:hypothetical protein